MLIAAWPPYEFWFLGWVALVPLLVAIKKAGPRESGVLGILCATLANIGVYHWCQELMDTYTSMGFFSWLVLAAVCSYQALPLGLWCWLLRSNQKRRPSSSPTTAWLLSVSTFVALEHFHPVFFPLYLSTSQHSNSFYLSLVEWGGMSALSLLMVSVNVTVATVLSTGNESDRVLWPSRASSRVQILVVNSIVFLLLTGACWVRRDQIDRRIHEAATLGVGLIQANHWIDEKDPLSALHDYQSMSLELIKMAEKSGKRLDLLVWPESAVRTPPPLHSVRTQPSVLLSGSGLSHYPLGLSRVQQGKTQVGPTLARDMAARDELFSIQRGHQIPVLFGTSLEDQSESAVPAISGRKALYNCAVLLDEFGEVRGTAAKVKLMMFGEFIPLAARFPQIYDLIPAASALLAGEEPQVIPLQGVRLGVMICYEDVLSSFHYRLAVKRPQILINLTNDAWFGKTKEAEAHLGMAKFRAAEARASLVRVTSTGMTSVVDAQGDTVAKLAQDTKGTLHVAVPILDIETLFERWGSWVAWLCLVISLLLGFQLGKVETDEEDET